MAEAIGPIDRPGHHASSIVHRRLVVGAALVVTALLVAIGGTGIAQYARTFWLYRGFAPPTEPTVVITVHHGQPKRVHVVRGTQEIIEIPGPAIGGRIEPAFVYLPPGYFQHPSARYPVLYVLHGSPGGPINFERVIAMGDIEDVLVAEGRARPMILVAPTGSPSTFADTEWANSPRPGNDWASYVADDVVTTIDRLFRTIPEGSDRGIAGLSEGGYGALNIALQYPGEFDLVESWSGYMTADGSVAEAWGRNPTPALLAANSPAVEVGPLAAELRRHHAYIWFYCGTTDPLLGQNEAFARQLGFLRIAHAFIAVSGGHTWVLWRKLAWQAYEVASTHFARLT